jgi:hypothetical protein
MRDTKTFSEENAQPLLFERVIEHWLTSSNERQYQLPFRQLLSAEGEEVIYASSHNPFEKGKDLVSIRDGEIRAYQLKSGDLDLTGWRRYEGEINNLVELPVELPSVRNKEWHVPYLVLNGDVTEPVWDYIRASNCSWKMRGFPHELKTVTKGELLTRFRAIHGTYLPLNVNDFTALLHLILRPGAEPADKPAFALMLESILRDRAVQSRLQARRAIASSILLTSYVVSNAQVSANWWSEFELWILMASYVLYVASTHSMERTDWAESFGICQDAANMCMQGLAEECMARPNFIEGDPITDGHFYRFRISIICGMLAAWALSTRIAGKVLVQEDFVFDFVSKHIRDGRIWGESGVPYYVCCLLLLDTRAKGLSAESIAISLVRTVAAENGADEKRRGLPNPYLDVEQSVRHAFGIGEPRMEGFAGFSYSVWPLIEYLARNWRRQALHGLWRSITRMSMLEYKPTAESEWLRWRSETSLLQNKLPPEPQSWARLLVESESVDCSNVPRLLLDAKSFLPFFLLVFPHRYCSAFQKLLEDTVLERRIG